MGKIAGICYIKADGVQFEVAGDVEVPLNTVKREPVMGLAGLSGYKETAVEHYTKLTANFTSDFPLAQIQSATNLTITTELPNGKVYTLAGGFLAGDPTVKPVDGQVDLEFRGKDGSWQ